MKKKTALRKGSAEENDEPDVKESEVIDRFESNSSKIYVYKKADKKKLFKKEKPEKKKRTREECEKQLILNSVMGSFYKINAPKPKKYKKGIEYDYKEGEVFERFYVKNLSYFYYSRDVCNVLELLAEGLSRLHNTPVKEKWKREEKRKRDDIDLDRKDVALVHGDLNPENMICKRNEINLIDPSPRKLHSFYMDIAKFLHLLNFKVPLKFLSLKAHRQGKFYEDYFLRRYESFLGSKVDRKKLNEYKLHFAKKQRKELKKGAENNHNFRKRVVMKMLNPLFFVLLNKKMREMEERLK